MEENELQTLISTLPKSKGWMFDTQYQYQGYWYDATILRGVLITQKQSYELQLEMTPPPLQEHSYSSSPPSAVLLASHPKTGTTWMKSLLFAITTRTQYNNLQINDHPLLKFNPHDCVPSIELHAFNNPSNPVPPNRSLLATHIPFHSLPDSIKSHRIVYVYRDPKDVLISFLHFANRYRIKSKTDQSLLSVIEAANLFCEGKSVYGPYWDHALSYWEESIKKKNEQLMLFVGYEELKSKPVDCLKKLASFIGQPFSADEETGGVLERILDLCSFNKLSDLKVNKADSVSASMPNFMKMTNDLFFRKADVGDHRNYLTLDIIRRFDEITEMKWIEAGFVEKTYLHQ